MGRQHQRRSRWNVINVVDEDHTLGDELVYDMAVVDDLVIAVDGRFEHPDHPGQGLDGLFHPGTEAPGLSQNDAVYRHSSRLPGSAIGANRSGADGTPGRSR